MTARAAALALLLVLSVGCATVVEDTEAPVDTSAESTTTTMPSGTTDELLDRMVTLMRGLNAQIADEGDEKATLAEIEAIWVVVRPDVEATNPELLNGIDTAVEMSRTAVVRIRPADADKAAQILGDQIERYEAG